MHFDTSTLYETMQMTRILLFFCFNVAYKETNPKAKEETSLVIIHGNKFF